MSQLFIATAGSSSSYANTATNVSRLASIQFDCVPGGTTTYPGVLTRANYPIVNVVGTVRGKEINFINAGNLLDIMEIGAQKEGISDVTGAVPTLISGRFHITDPDNSLAPGVDVENLQVSILSWPAAGNNVPTTVTVYTDVIHPDVPNAGKSPVVNCFNYKSATSTSERVGGDTTAVYLPVSNTTSLSNACGIIPLAELKSKASDMNDVIFAVSDVIGAANPVMGFWNYVPAYPQYAAEGHLVNFSSAGSYITVQRTAV